MRNNDVLRNNFSELGRELRNKTREPKIAFFSSDTEVSNRLPTSGYYPIRKRRKIHPSLPWNAVLRNIPDHFAISQRHGDQMIASALKNVGNGFLVSIPRQRNVFGFRSLLVSSKRRVF